MRRKLLTTSVTVGLCAAVFAAAAYGQGQGKGKPPKSTPTLVTSQVRDVDNTSVLLLRSDGFGPYASGDGVVSQIFEISGDWELELRNQTARTVSLTFITSDGSVPAVPSGLYNARLISRCFDADGSISGYFEIAEGMSNVRCALRVGFDAGGNSYFLVMSPLFQGTSWVTVTCAADTDANTTCERWVLAPGASSDLPTASLYRLNRNKELYVGSYYLTFSIEVLKP